MAPSSLATVRTRALRSSVSSVAVHGLCTRMVPLTWAPAAVSDWVVDWTRLLSAPGSTTTAISTPESRPARSTLLLAVVNASRFSAAAFAASSCCLRAVLSARRLSTVEVKVSPIWLLSGPAPRAIPTASARKIETIETRW